MSKSLQRGILFSICVALVLALSLTLVFFAGGGDNDLSAPQGQVSNAAQNTTTYTHGSKIKRDVPSRTNATYVSTGEQFKSALSSNPQKDIVLENDIEYGSSTGTDVSFSRNIYGQGYKITFTGALTDNRTDGNTKNDGTYWGGLIGTLSGNMYDLNVVMSSGQITILNKGTGTIFLGGLLGRLNGGTIENCTMTLSDSGTRIGAVKNSSEKGNYAVAAAMVAMVEYGSTIRNCTVSNNAWIESGLGTWENGRLNIVDFTNSTGGWGSSVDGRNQGRSGNLAGQIGHWDKSGTVTIDNIIITNTKTGDSAAQVKGIYVGNIGIVLKGTTLNVTNFYNDFSGTYICANNGGSATISHDNTTDGTATITNYYVGHGAVASLSNSSTNEAATKKTNTINVPENTNVYFDPSASDISNSLAIVDSTSNAPAGSNMKRTYTITGQNGYSKTSTEISTTTAGTDTVIFRNLSTNASNWNNGGNFGYNVTYKDTPRFNDYRDDLKFYEHGYATSQTKTDTPISSSDDWLKYFGQNASGGGDSSSPLTGNYYLKNDIVISGFSGKFFNGTFDGNGHTIYIIGVSQDSYGNPGIGGVIGTLMSGGTIKNMRVVLVNELTVNGPSNGRVGGVVGHIQGGTLENVTVLYDDTAALISETTSNDITIGGVAGRATANAQIKNVTLEMESGSRLAPKSGWTYLAGVVGIIDAANGATFKNIVLRGTGNFNADSDNDNQPPYYAAIANTKAEGYNGSDQYASINGLIYDFTAQLNGTFNGSYGEGQDHCSMYYLFSNNWHNGSGSVGSYHNLVSYSNIFIAEGKGGELAENVGDRFSSSSGNAPIMIESDTTPYTIARNVSSAMNRYDDARVTAYFQPVDVTIGSDYNYAVGDLVLKVSGHNWQKDESLMVNVGGGTGKVISYLEDPNEPTSDRIVKLTKDQAVMAATNNLNTVQVSDLLHVAQPQLANELTYTGSGIDVTFVVRYESESGSAQMGEELPSSAYTVSFEAKEGGTGSVVDGKPVNAGEYVATITLTNGDTFLVSGTGGDSTTATVEFSVKPFIVQGTWALDDRLTLAYGDPVPSNIDQYISVSLTTSDIPGGLKSVAASGFDIEYTQGTAAGTTVNIIADTYAVDSGLTAGNYDFTGITGSGSLEVQKKELSITLPATEEDPYIPHIKAVYGATGDKAAVQGLLTQKIIEDYVTGIYNDEVVSFTIDTVYIAATDEESGEFTLAGAEEVADENIASLDANSYLITVTANSSNYTVAEGQFFVYGVTPVTLTVTGVTFEGDFDGVYDGQAHGVEVQFSGLLVGDDSYNFAISISGVEGTSVTDAGDYTVTVDADEYNPNYDVTYENGAGDSTNEYAVTISPITLTIRDKSGVYTELTAADIVIADMVSGILEGDTSGVTITPVWNTQPADENGYLAAGTYNATLSLSGDKSANYTIGSDNIATVTVDQFDLRGAHITITSEQFTYDGTEKTVEYTVLTAEGGKDITALLTPAGNKQTNANYNYTLTLTGGDNFTNQATATWSIGRAKLSVTAPTDITFMDKAASELSDYLTKGKWITGFFGSDGYALGAWTNDPEDSAVPIGDVAYAAAGTYTATVQLTGENADTNYELSENTLSVTVNELDISGEEVAVTWKENLTYNAEKQSVSLASVTVRGVVMPVEWFTLQNNTGTDAGTYPATVAASNANITGSVRKEFTIAPFAVTVKWEAAGEISVGTAMPKDDTDMSALGLTARVTEFKAPGITEAAQYSIVVTASGFDAGHIFTTGEKVTLTPSMTFGQGVKENNYVVTFDPKTIEKAATAISVVVSPAKETVSVTYGDSVKSADGFISAVYFTIMSGAEGSALTPDNFTVTVTYENGAAVFGTHGLDAGTYTVTIEGKGAYSVSNENNFFTYTVAPLTLTQGTWSGVDGLTYNGKAAAPVFKPEGVLEGDSVTATVTVTGEVTEEKAINAGKYTATAQSGNANYVFDGKVNVKTFTIAQMVLQGGLTVDPDLTYDGTSKAGYATWTWTTAPLKEGDVTANITFTKDGEQADPIAAGDYTAIVTLTDNTGNYDTTEITSTVDFTIEQLEVVLNWEADGDLVYNGAPHELTATVSNKVVGDEVEVSVELAADNNNVNVTEQGFVYVAIGLTGAAASNYKLPENAQSEAKYITPATLEISAVTLGENGVYDGNEKNMFLTVTYSVPPIGEDSPAVVMAVQDYETNGFTNAGEYTVNVSLAPSDVNYKLGGTTTFTVTIEKADITVAVNVGDKTYDGSAVTPSVTVRFGERELAASEYGTVTYTYAIKDGDTLDAAPADASDSAYTVTASVAESTNFNAATSAAVEFKIARKTLTQGTWSDVDGLTYNGKAAAPVFKPAGVLDGDNVSVGYTIEGDKATGGQAINAGSYIVTAKLEGDDAGNYEFDGVVNVEEFTIARKELTVVKDSTLVVDFGVIGETTNTYKEQIASWDSAKDKVITGFVDNDDTYYTLVAITTTAEQEAVYTDGKLNAGSYYVSYTVGDNYTIGSSGQVGLIPLTVNKLSYEISLTYAIDGVDQSAWDGNISFEHDAPITLTLLASNALEISFNDGSNHTHVVTVEYDGDGTLPNVTFKLGGITINGSYSTATISSVQSMNVVAQITPYDYTNHEFTGTTSFKFAVTRNTRVEANEGYFDGLSIPSEYKGSSSSISVADIDKTEAFTVTLGGTELTGAEVSIAATLNGEPTENIRDAGDYVITATYTTDNDEVVTGTYEFTVAQAKLSFTLGSAPAIVYGEMSADDMPEALKAFTATGVNGVSVKGTFAITVGLNENIYSNAGFVKAGSYDFTITFTPDDDNYAELVYDSAGNGDKLTVEKKTITPSAISYGEVTSVDKTLTLTYAGKDAYADGRLEITPMPNDILNRDVVEFMDEGNYSKANEDGHTPQVRIYESGDGGNYKLDLSGWKVVVLKKAIKVTVTADSDTYTGSAIKLTASSEEVVEGDEVTFTVSGDNVVDETVKNAGTYALTVTLDGDQGDNYEVAGEPSVTIGKAIVDIVWTNEAELNSAVYNGQPYEAEVDVRFNGQSVGSASIKYTSDEVTVTDGKAVNAGSYTAEATFAGTDNYNATTESYDFTIAKMVLDGEWKVASDMNMTYDGTSKAGYATWTWTTEPVNESDVTVGYKYELGGAIVDDVIDAGNYNVYAVFTGNTGNYDTESGILQGDRFDELTVARRAVTVKWSESVSFTYNGAEQAPAATAQNVVEGDSLTLTVTGAKKDVGTYTATVEADSVTGNYVLAEDSTIEFTIARKTVSVAWGTTEFTYNGSAQVPTATATGLVGGDSLTLIVTGAQTDAGSYTATVKAFEQGNYKLESTSTRTFTIKKADLTVLTVTPASLEIRERETEDMQAFAEGENLAEAFADRIRVSGVSGPVRYTVTIAGEDNYDDDGLLTVGAHTFTIDAGNNYNAASVSVTVIATPVVTVIASVEGELVYNGSAFEISYALKEGAPVDVSMDDITVTASVETIVNAGEYKVTFTVTGSNEDYDYVVQDASGNAALTFTIAQRGLDVAEVAEAVYGDLQVSGTLVTGTHTAFVAYNDEEIELIVNVKAAALSRAAAEYLDAGEYEVTIALVNEKGNFSLNGATLNVETQKMEVESTLDVAPKTVTVGYTPSSKVYDAKGITVTLGKFEVIEGDDHPAVNIYINDALYTGKVVLDAGEYTVRYESADPNYAFEPVSATFTVESKKVTPSFDLNTGTGSQQITGGGKLEIEEGEETDIVAAIDSFMQSSGVSEEEMSIAVSGDLKLEDMATWAPGTYTVTVTLSGNHSGSMQFTVEVSEKIELPPPVQPELPETPVEAGSGNDWVLPLVIAIVALIDLALLVAIGVAAKKRA